MTTKWDVIGHQNIIKYLDNCLKGNRLVNTYLFYGNQHLGKTKVALRFAKEILQSEVVNNPDLFELKLEAGSKDITIDEVRDWQRWLSLKSFSGGYKVGIIHNLEALNRQSANALLKTIEEPSAKTILILISSAWEQLLPTIISRSQKIHFLIVPNKELKNGLKDRLADNQKLDQIINFSLGKPGLALSLIEDNEFYNEYVELNKGIDNLTKSNLATRFKYIEDYLNGKTLQENNVLASNLLRHLEFNLRNKLLNELDDIKTLEVLIKLQETKSYLKYNIKPQLILENLFINI